MTLDEFCSAIVEARRSGVQTQAPVPEPNPSVETAMDIQTKVFEEYGSPSVGWKVGAANQAAQQAFGLDEPFYGPMAASGVLGSGSDVTKTECTGAIEPEYAFKMARDFPAVGENINHDTATSAVGSVHIAIEVIGRCAGNPDMANGLGVTLDFGGNAAFIVGSEISDWSIQDLTHSPVSVTVDGDEVQTGSGAAVMESPINSLVWMAQALAKRGHTLKAGEWVSTGTCTPPVPAQAGKTVVAKFGDFGEVSVSFT